MATEPKASKSVDALQEEYLAISGLCQRLAVELELQLNKLLLDAGISLAFPLQKRIKSWESLEGKFKRLRLQVDNIHEVQDLVGFRIIILFLKDLKRVEKIIGDHLTVLKQYDTSERLGADQFGYSSVHFVIRLPATWLAVPSLSGLDKIQAEIQLRTLSQHMWAEASNLLQYKREEAVPIPVRRAISRGAALLESVDIEFDRILAQRDVYRNELDVTTEDQNLNVDLLEKVLDSLLPKQNKTLGEAYGALLNEFGHFGIVTVSQLRALAHKRLIDVLRKEQDRVLEEERDLYANQSRLGEDEQARVKRGVYFTHTGLARSLMELEFGMYKLQNYWAGIPLNQPTNQEG